MRKCVLVLERGDPTGRGKEEQRGKGVWEWTEGWNVNEQTAAQN